MKKTYYHIPSSYEVLFKHNYHYPYFWEESKETDERIMLGGKYSSVDDSTSEYIHLKLNANINDSTIHYSQLKEKIDFCPFQIGDIVKFVPKCSKEDTQFLLSLDNYKLKNSNHKVVHILNKYYIFIDYQDYKEKGIPFRWIDFEKVEK
jgi:hypothetical protein